MSFENLVADLEKDAKVLEDKTLKDAATQADATREKTKEQVAQIIATGKKDALSIIEEKKSEISTATIAARKIIAEGKNAAVEKAIKQVKEELVDYTQSKQYPALVIKLTDAAINELGSKQNMQVLCRKEDVAILKKANFNVQPSLECIGGVIVQTKDGKIRIDSTFENLLVENSDELKQTAFSELFGKSSPVRSNAAIKKKKRGD